MKKVIALSTVLGLSALGMACGDAAPANNAANKPANTATPAPVATVAPATPAVNANATNTANKMADNKAADTVKPAANAPKANANAAATPKS